MDRLKSMRTFCMVVDAGSFSRAAERADLNSAAVTRLVADLERHLGTRLLNRSTRSLSLTEAGREYLTRCRLILEDIDEAESEVREHSGLIRGHLRLLASATVGLELLAPHLVEYRRLYPNVSVELDLADQMLDMVEAGYDLAIIPSVAIALGSLVARTLFQTPIILCAAPGYLKGKGTPVAAEDLVRHACLNFSHPTLRDTWLLRGARGEEAAALNNVLLSNNSDVLRVAARTGMGICVTGQCYIEDDLRAGTLIRVLPDFDLGQLEIQLAYPSRKFVSAKTRSMIDFLTALFQTP